MPRTAYQLRSDAERIWRAGVAAVLPDRLIRSHVRVDGDLLFVDDEAIELRRFRRVGRAQLVLSVGFLVGAQLPRRFALLGTGTWNRKRETFSVACISGCTSFVL